MTGSTKRVCGAYSRQSEAEKLQIPYSMGHQEDIDQMVQNAYDKQRPQQYPFNDPPAANDWDRACDTTRKEAFDQKQAQQTSVLQDKRMSSSNFSSNSDSQWRERQRDLTKRLDNASQAGMSSERLGLMGIVSNNFPIHARLFDP